MHYPIRIFYEPQCLYLAKEKYSPVLETIFLHHAQVDDSFIHSFFLWLKETVKNDIAFVYTKPEVLLHTLFRHLIKIDAAGGIVVNPRNEILMIYRLGKWDLPKGKTDEGETHEEAAVREVKEECGVDGLKIIAELSSTYHVYPIDNSRWAIKETKWYFMEAGIWENPTPQTQEKITDAKWMSIKEALDLRESCYRSISYMIETTAKDGLEKMHS